MYDNSGRRASYFENFHNRGNIPPSLQQSFYRRFTTTVTARGPTTSSVSSIAGASATATRTTTKSEYNNGGINSNYHYYNFPPIKCYSCNAPQQPTTTSGTTGTGLLVGVGVAASVSRRPNYHRRGNTRTMPGGGEGYHPNYCDMHRKIPDDKLGNNNKGSNWRSNNNFFNGIKHIVNGFIYSAFNCDNYFDRRCVNNNGFNNNNRSKNLSQQRYIHTMATGNSNKRRNRMNYRNVRNTRNPEMMESRKGETSMPIKKAMFTDEDFPELPKPKKPSSLSWNQNSNSTITSHCSRKNNNNNNNKSSNRNYRNNMEEESPCTSIDDFVIVSKNIDTTKPNKSSSSSKYCWKPDDGDDDDNDENGEPPATITTAIASSSLNRSRSLSECSDDSFVICFNEGAPEGVIEYHSDDFDEDTDTDDGDYENNNNVNGYQKETQHNDDNDQLDSGFDEQKLKKVRFDLKPKVYLMCAWNYAYRAARKGCWENYARDRLRFKHRIENLEYILNPVLSKAHRDKIYNERFSGKDIENNELNERINVDKFKEKQLIF